MSYSFVEAAKRSDDDVFSDILEAAEQIGNEDGTEEQLRIVTALFGAVFAMLPSDKRSEFIGSEYVADLLSGWSHSDDDDDDEEG